MHYCGFLTSFRYISFGICCITQNRAIVKACFEKYLHNVVIIKCVFTNFRQRAQNLHLLLQKEIKTS